MFIVVAAMTTAAVLGQVVKWDDQNQHTKREGRKNRALARNIGRETREEPVTALPEFLEVEHPSFGCSVLMTGREVIWWETEGRPHRDHAKVARKIRYIIKAQPQRLALVRAGRASIA